MRNYTRWVMGDDPTKVGQIRPLHADILGASYQLTAYPEAGTIVLDRLEELLSLSPDEARMLGVRLIEAAALADGDRAIRKAPQ